MNILLLLFIASVILIILAKARERIAIIRTILLTVAIVGGFTLFYIGYKASMQPYEESLNLILRAAQATARMLLMQPDYRGVETSLNNTLFYWSFIVVNAISLVVFLLAAMALFARRSYGWLRLIAKFNAQSYIFTNNNEQSITLARDIIKQNPKALIVFLNQPTYKGDSSLFNTVESIGGAYIESSKRNPLELLLLRVHTSISQTHIFCISDEEDTNIADAISIIDSIGNYNNPSIENSTNLHIRLYSNDIRESFEEYVRISRINVEYNIFSDAELIAYDLVTEYPPIDLMAIDVDTGTVVDNYEVMIVGFDRKGQAALRKMIEFGQFVGSTFKATIVDKNINQKRGSFEALYPALEGNYNLNYIQTFVGERQFFELLKRESRTLKQIVIALGNDSLNIQTAIEINKLLSQFGENEAQILVVVSSDKNYNYIHSSQDLNAIHCIGQQTKIFTEDNVVKGAVSLQARRINEYYRQNNPSKPEWRNLEYIKKESNISVAIHAYTKMRLMGLSDEKLRSFDSAERYKLWLEESPSRLDNLARSEHLRWNASYFTRGWQRWELSQIPSDNKNGQDHIRKLHCCLVDWELLPEVDKWAGQEIGAYQGYDYDNTFNLYGLSCEELLKQNDNE